MDWALAFCVISFGLGIVISAGIARYAWQHRSIPGARYYALLQLFAIEYSLCSIFQHVSQDYTAELFWRSAGWWGAWLTPVVWLAFALQYTGRGAWITVRRLVLLALEPVVALSLIAGVTIEVLVRSARDIQFTGPTLLEKSARLAPPVTGLYVLAMFVASTVLVLRTRARAPRVYHARYLLLLIGIWLPWFFGLLDMFELRLFPIELIPIASAVAGLIST